jgi:hypothetical protein
MKKKVKRFQEGGFTKEQEEWLGGADRTDPYILARMRKAVPDNKPMASEMGDDSPAGKTGYGEQNELLEVETTKSVTKPQSSPKKQTPVAKPVKEVVTEKPKSEPKKSTSGDPSFFKGTKGYKNVGELFKAMRQGAGITSYKSGGSVSSASKRADGCAVRGKTRA